jgi:hypothetical protein
MLPLEILDRRPEKPDESLIIEQPKVREADIRRAHELIEKYGWYHLIDRGNEPPPGE